MTMHTESIKRYYSDTQFEYKLLWNWKLKTAPALHLGYYDEKATTHKQAIERVNEVMADWANIQPGARIIDAGCGLGQSSLWLAQNRKARVTGITIVPKQVETIQKYIAKHNIPNVDFIEANYFNMPFGDNSADLVWAIESVCHAEDKSMFYKEAFRVLKPGGKLLIAENLRVARPMDEEKEEMLKQLFRPWAIPDLDTPEEHANHAKRAGFSSFHAKDVTANMLTSYRNLEEICKRWAWLNHLLCSIGVISEVRRGNMIGSMRQYDGIKKKVFTYHHLMAVK